ncbi:hypothetical protein [Acuticoccus kandeliae]|uniref:hypothetical protein n=1 Tax=Acuticoccus kandeliae TaxID=2073160 RepID=UPI000D3E2C6E|nr:hypothetical protein [Acuticoccus kandeliae]
MSTKDNIDREVKSAKEKANEAADVVRDAAENVGSDLKGAAASYAEDGKAYAASHITDFATAVRRASNELAERDQGVAARVVTQAADGLEQVAKSISGTSVDEMVVSVERFARRNPSAFVFGTILAGVAIGRFAKATSDRASMAEPMEPMPHETRQPTTPKRPVVGPASSISQ